MQSHNGAHFSSAEFRAKRGEYFTAPPGWYFFCFRCDLVGKPAGMQLGADRYVGFLDAAGRTAVLNARCAHMGADLARGSVSQGRVQCPFHGWQYGSDGRCMNIPVGGAIPEFARQAAYPTAEHGGLVFFYNRPVAPYPMPFFDGVDARALIPARPFEFLLDAPWYIAGANAFDMQHFHCAHDRMLVGEPVVDCPADAARRIVATYAVTGPGWRDSLMRRFGGDRVTMSVTVWGGPLLLVTARTRGTTTYGLTSVKSLSKCSAVVQTIVWTPRHEGIGALLDGANVRIRRSFIRAFLRSDVVAARGTRYTPGTLINADREMAGYFDWLGRLWPPVLDCVEQLTKEKSKL